MTQYDALSLELVPTGYLLTLNPSRWHRQSMATFPADGAASVHFFRPKDRHRAKFPSATIAAPPTLVFSYTILARRLRSPGQIRAAPTAALPASSSVSYPHKMALTWR